MGIERADFIRGLREFADFVEQHPDVPVPGYEVLIDVFPADLVATAQALSHFEKAGVGEYFVLRRWFGRIRVEWNAPRETVCRKIILGTRRVEDKLIPAHDEEIVEWECTEPLLAVDRSTATG